jgi:hypothetical protein
VTETVSRLAFAHASEAELARILDFYQVAWDYEPHTFPILFDRDGAVLESFSPDFYLPELDLYVEITTLRQRLVRKKNRKLRRLLELYPGIRVKLLYARDFRALLLKYGRITLADALSGAEGQATPSRPAIPTPDDAGPGRPGTSPGRAAAGPISISEVAPIAAGARTVTPGAAARARRSRRARAEARERAALARTAQTVTLATAGAEAAT